MGIKNQRKGYICKGTIKTAFLLCGTIDKEHAFIFTHYDPVKHLAWSDDIKDERDKKNSVWGYWIPYDMIKWL